MVNVEVREKEVKAAEAELKAETAEIEKEKEDARKVTAEDQKKLAEWNAKRDGLRQGISEDILRHYERVAKFRGTGLAEVRDHKCMGCQVTLRPQTVCGVNGHWEEKEMGEGGYEIVSNTLDLLHKDLLAIQREHRSSHKDHSASPAEQTAAR